MSRERKYWISHKYGKNTRIGYTLSGGEMLFWLIMDVIGWIVLGLIWLIWKLVEAILNLIIHWGKRGLTNNGL